MADEPTSQLDQIVAEYLRAAQSGEPVDRDVLLARHPDLADSLADFFADYDRVAGLARPLSPAPRREFVPPRVRYFGDYELLDEIARGGMGVVYKARQTSLNRVAAVKMILSGHLATEEDVKRFRAEAQAAANLQHPGIVAVHEVGIHQGQHYFSMDYVEGTDLAAMVRENPLPARRAAAYVEAVAEAVHYAHQQGTLHRDLKPSNVLVDRDDKVRITDFGLAVRIDPDSLAGDDRAGELTRTGQIVGTPSYMAPEQAQARRGLIGPASDVYSMGVILYELTTGRPPFRSESAVETLHQVIHADPASPRLLNPRVPRDLETICLKCLEKEPHKRYATAGLLADDLRRYLAGEPILARPISRPARLWRWCRRNPAVAALVGVSTLATVAIVAGLVTSNLLITRALDGRTAALNERTEALGRLRAEEERARAALGEKTQAFNALRTQEDETKRALERESQALAERTRTLEELRKQEQETRAALGREQDALAESTRANQALKDALGREERTSSYNRIALARREWLATNVQRADEILDETRPDLRGWEWHYLKRLCNQPGLKLLRGYAGRGDALPLTRDGTRLALAFGAREVRLLDAATGAQVATFTPAGWHVTSVAISPDGRLVAAATAQPHSLILWDTSTGEKRIEEVGTDFKTECLAFSPDGARLAAVGTVPKQEPQTERSKTKKSNKRESQLRIWSTTTGQPELLISTGATRAESVAFSPSGDRLVTVSGVHATMRDAATGRKLFRLGGLSGGVAAVAFSPDGSRIAAAGDADTTVKIWNAETGEQLPAFFGTSRGLLPIPRPSFQMSIGGQTVHGSPHGILSLAYSKDGTRLSAAAGNGSVTVWNTETGQEVLLVRQPWGFGAVAFSPDGRRLITTNARIRGIPDECKVWDATSGQEAVALREHRGICWDIAFSPDGRHVATSSSDGAVRLWDAKTYELVHTFRHNTRRREVFGLAFSPDCRMLASGGADATIRLWDIENRLLLRELSGHKEGVHTVAFSPDGTLLASASRDKTVQIWKTDLWEVLHTLEGHTDWVTTVAFSPDGRRLVSASIDKTVRTWDPRTGKEQGPPKEHSGRVYSVAFSPDAKLLASASTEGSVECRFSVYNPGKGRALVVTGSGEGAMRIWNAETGEDRVVIRQPDVVYDVAFNADGARLASTCRGTVKLWDTTTGQEILSLAGGTHAVTFDREGKRLASAASDGVVRIWDATPLDDDLEFQRHRAAHFAYIGRVRAEAGRTEDAIAEFQKARTIFERLADARPELSRDVASCLQGMGDAYLRVRRREEALAQFEQALRIYERLVCEQPEDVEHQLAMARLLNTLGSAAAMLRRHDRAAAALERAIAIRERIASGDDGDRQPPEALGTPDIYVNLIRVHRGRDEPHEALAVYRRLLERQRRLAEAHPAEARWEAHVAKTLNSIALLHQDRLGDLEECRKIHRQALRIRERLACEHPDTADFTVDLGGTCCNLGNLDLRCGEPRAAIEWYQASIARLTTAHSRWPHHANGRLYLRNAHWGRARTLDGLERHAEAVADWRRAMQLDRGQTGQLFRVHLSLALARAGDHLAATAEAAQIAAASRKSDTDLYNAACTYALSAAAAVGDSSRPVDEREQLVEKYAGEAMSLLNGLRESGYFENRGRLDELRTDRDLDPLRQCEAFRTLLEQVDAGPTQPPRSPKSNVDQQTSKE